MYLYIDSTSSSDYFSDNSSVDFRVKLPKQLQLYGAWELAVISVTFPALAPEYKGSVIYINTDICEESVYNSTLQCILCNVHRRDVNKERHVEFIRPSYVRLNAEHVSVLRVYLTDNKRQQPLFQSGAFYCTLHLRKCLHQ